LLGDVARLSGHSSEARRAYAAVRERFSGSSEAAQAAFALGRLALHANGDRIAAQQWFETHLRERPNGPLAAAAMGRLIELHLQASDTPGAAAVAREYVQRFPGGPQAGEARKVLEASGADEHR
jgi:TolA-binding protein